MGAGDRNLALTHQSEQERRREEYRAQVLAARVRLREARRERDVAPWFRAWSARREVRLAEDELARLRASPPPEPEVRGFQLD